MSKLYIGLSGKMGSGKTTLTNGLIAALPSFNIEVISLAKPIKDIQNMIYKELNIEMIGEKDRDLLIALGMWGRGKSNSFWLSQAINKFEESAADIVICDDVRFKNEADFFDLSGILIRIEGEQRGPNVDVSRKSDATEVDLDSYSFTHRLSNLGNSEDMVLDTLKIIAARQKVVEELSNKGGHGG